MNECGVPRSALLDSIFNSIFQVSIAFFGLWSLVFGSFVRCRFLVKFTTQGAFRIRLRVQSRVRVVQFVRSEREGKVEGQTAPSSSS